MMDLDSQAAVDSRNLANMGHKQALRRSFGTLSMLSLAFSVLATWSTIAQDLSSGLVNGGPVVVLWGLVVVAVCNVCVAASLGELCSSMPTALGQAYWTARLCGWRAGDGASLVGQLDLGPSSRFAAYVCAWVSTFGWWTLAASQVAFMADFILAMRLIFDDSSKHLGPGWLRFLVYVGITIALTVINLVSCRRAAVLPAINNFVGIGCVGLFFVFAMALSIAVATSQGRLSFQPASFVLGRWINATGGWPDGVVCLLGLVQGAYGLTAFDAVIHMAEEIPAPGRYVPRVMCYAVSVSALSAFVFLAVCLACVQDLDRLLDPPSGFPFIELTRSVLGPLATSILIGLFIFNNLGQTLCVFTSASRLTWSFARARGMPFGAYFSHVDPLWNVPARALWLQAAIVSLVGLLYFFADAVLQAVLSVTTVANTLSCAIPILCLVLAGRDCLPPREFDLGPRLGHVANAISLVYCAVTSVFFFFPTATRPAPADMNYAIAVLGIMLAVAFAFWFVQGYSTFMVRPEPVKYADKKSDSDIYDPDMAADESWGPLTMKALGITGTGSVVDKG
ncbi:hypothetical protein G6O67_008462 [Ophiocordyceps sinensis]|uniref:Amino acid/polyamine transporter I n=1 Tax=Ophiocordyceps sinensis TaxID=72228 RepID=A0A8H4PN06_9HYPO|nr:hypothetical protein G6O67_008462 [Ophiocordyceps sinensis]